MVHGYIVPPTWEVYCCVTLPQATPHGRHFPHRLRHLAVPPGGEQTNCLCARARRCAKCCAWPPAGLCARFAPASWARAVPPGVALCPSPNLSLQVTGSHKAQQRKQKLVTAAQASQGENVAAWRREHRTNWKRWMSWTGLVLGRRRPPG